MAVPALEGSRLRRGPPVAQATSLRPRRSDVSVRSHHDKMTENSTNDIARLALPALLNLESALLEYVERYGPTDTARQALQDLQGGAVQQACAIFS